MESPLIDFQFSNHSEDSLDNTSEIIDDSEPEFTPDKQD